MSGIEAGIPLRYVDGAGWVEMPEHGTPTHYAYPKAELDALIADRDRWQEMCEDTSALFHDYKIQQEAVLPLLRAGNIDAAREAARGYS